MPDTVSFDSLVAKHKLLEPDGPVCLIVQATMGVAAGLDRFQPAGFPEIGHVIYDAPRDDGRSEKVCIVDSPASMARGYFTSRLRAMKAQARSTNPS